MTPLGDALLAARLYLLSPDALGGMVLRGGGPARDRVLEALAGGRALHRLPAHIDEARLLGGVDIVASLSARKPVLQPGLLDQAKGGVLLAPMAERMRDALAGRLAQAMDGGAGFGLVLLDDGLERDEGVPAALADRVAFHCDLSEVQSLDAQAQVSSKAVRVEDVTPLSDEMLATLAKLGAAFGIESARSLMFALSAARANAALAGRRDLESEDLQVATRLVLLPRATQLPQHDATEEESEQPPPPPDASDPGESDSSQPIEAPPEEVLLEAVLASLPPDVLEQIARGKASRSARGGGEGQRAKSKLRGKPLGARPGMPRDGARLALIDTLRAAVPWQPLRQQESGEADRLLVRRDDLRIRRFEERATTVSIFCVDASGSAAAARLAEAKGAVELILAQAYVKRSEVALVAFRGEGAELLLPPTRSLTRARRALGALPGGGGTPLASGLTLARQLGDSIAARGSTPFLVCLTDGSANIAADGTPGRKQAREDAEAAARAIAATSLEAVVIDISLRPRPDAAALAEAMGARYLPLPMADAQGLQRAVLAAQPERQKA